jgi:hypothetical protein
MGETLGDGKVMHIHEEITPDPLHEGHFKETITEDIEEAPLSSLMEMRP